MKASKRSAIALGTVGGIIAASAVALAAPTHAAVSVVSVDDAVLNVSMDNQSTTVRIFNSGNSTIIRQSGRPDVTVPTAGFNSVRVTGGNGNDEVDATGFSKPVLAIGNGGNDRLVGGNSSDTLVGGVGTDTLIGGGGDDTLVAIDGQFADVVEGGSGKDYLWYDAVGGNADTTRGVTAADTGNPIRSFANGADLSLNGDNTADPSLSSGAALLPGANYRRVTGPLFSSLGPKGTDVDQGGISDCKVVSALSSVAQATISGYAGPVRSRMADFGDGTFGVKLDNSYYRIDNELVFNAGGRRISAGNGAQGSLWVAIAEKAIALHDSGRFERLASTAPANVYRFFGSTTSASPKINEFASSATDLANKLWQRWNRYERVTMTLNQASTVNGVHAYTLWNVRRNAAGQVTQIQFRNPQATDGNVNYPVAGTPDANPGDGFVTLSAARLWTDAALGRVNWGSPVER